MTVTDAAAAARTIVVDTGPVKATDFDLDRDTQDFLFRQGRRAAVNFLDGAPGQPAWDWEAYKHTYRSSPSPVMTAAMQTRDALRCLRHRLRQRTQNGHRTPTAPIRPATASR